MILQLKINKLTKKVNLITCDLYLTNDAILKLNSKNYSLKNILRGNNQ